MVSENDDSTGADELQHRHLRGCILHGDSVRSQSEVTGTTNNVLIFGVIEMRIENLLRQSQRSV